MSREGRVGWWWCLTGLKEEELSLGRSDPPYRGTGRRPEAETGRATAPMSFGRPRAAKGGGAASIGLRARSVNN